MAEAIKIFLVDDDEVDRIAVQRALKSASFPYRSLKQKTVLIRSLNSTKQASTVRC
jgi:FixJ family two-component response regulator